MVLLGQISPWITGILIAVFLLVCILMILVVLIQRPAGGGLSGAFGSGAGSGQTAFGAKTGDALTFATVTVFFIYLLFAVGLNYAARPGEADLTPPTLVPQGVPPSGGPPPAEGEGIFAPPPATTPEEPPAAPRDPEAGAEPSVPPAEEPSKTP